MNNAMNTHQHRFIFQIFSLLSAIPSAVCLVPAAEITCLSVLLPQAVMQVIIHQHWPVLIVSTVYVNSLSSCTEVN